MTKNIRQRISHAIQTKFGLSPQYKPPSSPKSKITSCCSVKKPNDYEYISYQPKQTPKNHDYIDLSECHSWSSSYSKDSGISVNSNENCHALHSTKIYSDDSSSFSILSNLSYIPHDQMNISYSNVTTRQCCHCQCHHYINNNLLHGETNNYLYIPENRIKTKIYPFIF